MANETRLIDANAIEAKIEKNFRRLVANQTKPDLAAALSYVDDLIIEAPTVDAVEVVQIERVKQEILQQMDMFIEEYNRIGFYGKSDAIEVARRLVNAALTDLAKMDGGNK